MTRIVRFQQLKAWEVSHQLVLDVYRLVQKLPSCEQYGLSSQMRRAAVSVPANVAEGFKRRSIQEKVRFYNIAEASLEELKYYFILVHDLGYADEDESMLTQADQAGRLLGGLIASTERRAS